MIVIQNTKLHSHGINVNTRITDVLNELVEQIKLQQIIEGDQKHIYRLRNMQRGIQLISSMPKIDKISELPNAKGIGKGIRTRVYEILTKGSLDEISNVQEEVKQIINLSKVYGLGPKALKMLYHKNIKSIDSLKAAITSESCPIKIYTPTIISLKYHNDLIKRVPRQKISDMKKYLSDHIPTRFEICGSYRRGAKDSGDIDVLIMESSNLPCLEPLISALNDDGFLVAQLSGGSNKYNGICYYQNQYCRIDFLVTKEDEYYPALLHFTGSGLFNQIIRYHANMQGYKLSNLGLASRSGERQTIPTFMSEKDIFDFLGVVYLKPCDRNI